MNHLGASNGALSMLIHSHLPSWWWPVPAASVPSLHYLQNAPHIVEPLVRQSESPAVRQSGSPAVRQSGSPAVRQSESPAVRQSESPKVRKSESPKVRKSESPKLQNAALPSNFVEC